MNGGTDSLFKHLATLEVICGQAFLTLSLSLQEQVDQTLILSLSLRSRLLVDQKLFQSLSFRSLSKPLASIEVIGGTDSDFRSLASLDVVDGPDFFFFSVLLFRSRLLLDLVYFLSFSN